MGVKVSGWVKELEDRTEVSNLPVAVYEADLFRDDFLGETTTGPDGFYSIELKTEDDKGLFYDKPDLYVAAKNREGKVFRSTRDHIVKDVENDVEINMRIPRSALVRHGVIEEIPAPGAAGPEPEILEKYTAWILEPGCDKNDETLVQIQRDLEGKTSILELIKHYMDELKENPDNNAPPMVKMAKLFEFGAELKELNGDYFGVPTALKTGDQEGRLAEFGNVIGLLWGATLQDECPWVAKSFSPMDEPLLQRITSRPLKSEGPVRLGINHFNQIQGELLNTVSFHFLHWWLKLDPAPDVERETYGYEKNGGHFISTPAMSVYHGTPRKVLQLNYRWKNLDNQAPLTWLIDEMVQIADGLYFGQLLFATRRLFREYDPERPDSDSRYQHFGYFLLFDPTWNTEARRLFPYLEIPASEASAAAAVAMNVSAEVKLPKFTTLTLEEPTPAMCDDAVFEQVGADLKDKPTILHLFKEYSDILQKKFDNDSPLFLRLREIFNRGIGISSVKGFYRGALVSWNSQGIFNCFDVNTLNVAWETFAHRFSTWTGKKFENIDLERLKEITDGFEKGDIPTFWGSNTQSFKSMKEKFVGDLLELIRLPGKKASPEESLKYGYDLLNFFFIGHQAMSVDEETRGKTIFQFNYRWPKLETIVPDCFCVDELVQVAKGLHLGKLMYATEILTPYDPAKDPDVYKYRNFGYFLLMDEEWHRIRLRIGFDLSNT